MAGVSEKMFRFINGSNVSTTLKKANEKTKYLRELHVFEVCKATLLATPDLCLKWVYASKNGSDVAKINTCQVFLTLNKPFATRNVIWQVDRRLWNENVEELQCFTSTLMLQTNHAAAWQETPTKCLIRSKCPLWPTTAQKKGTNSCYKWGKMQAVKSNINTVFIIYVAKSSSSEKKRRKENDGCSR